MVSIEYRQQLPANEYTRWVQVIMTNTRSGVRYSMDVFYMDIRNGLKLPYRVLSLGKEGTHSACRTILTRNAPTWVKKTIEEQLPIVAIMLS